MIRIGMSDLEKEVEKLRVSRTDFDEHVNELYELRPLLEKCNRNSVEIKTSASVKNCLIEDICLALVDRECPNFFKYIIYFSSSD